jgi:Mg2+/citrate symporter
MKTAFLIFTALFLTVVLVGCFCCFALSSKISEEERNRLQVAHKSKQEQEK